MELKDFLLFLGPLLGVLVGGLITSLAKYMELDAGRAEAVRKERLTGLLDLHESLARFEATSHLNFGRMVKLRADAKAGKITLTAIYEAIHDIFPFRNVIAKQRVFAPELNDTWDELLDLADKLSADLRRYFMGDKPLIEYIEFFGRMDHETMLARKEIEILIHDGNLLPTNKLAALLTWIGFNKAPATIQERLQAVRNLKRADEEVAALSKQLLAEFKISEVEAGTSSQSTTEARVDTVK